MVGEAVIDCAGPDRALFIRGGPHPLGVLLATLAGLRHAVLMTSATNDNFLHMALAQQLRAGDWPIRDFFDGGWVLQYTLSAFSQLVIGDRLLAEAIIVGVAWACSTYIVFALVRDVSGSAVAATLAGILLLLAAARGYSYPKAIIYAVASLMWWRYIRHPATARAVWFGVWAAIAFYWRPDHGVYVAVAIASAVWAAHGIGRTWGARCVAAGAAMLALIAPLMFYAQMTFGLPQHLQTARAPRPGLEPGTRPLEPGDDVRFTTGARGPPGSRTRSSSLRERHAARNTCRPSSVTKGRVELPRPAGPAFSAPRVCRFHHLARQ